MEVGSHAKETKTNKRGAQCQENKNKEEGPTLSNRYFRVKITYPPAPIDQERSGEIHELTNCILWAFASLGAFQELYRWSACEL